MCPNCRKIYPIILPNTCSPAYDKCVKDSKKRRGVLVFLNLGQFSAELKETGSLGATESEVKLDR